MAVRGVPMVFAQDVEREATRRGVRAQLNAAQALAEQERDPVAQGDFVPVEFERRIRSANDMCVVLNGWFSDTDVEKEEEEPAAAGPTRSTVPSRKGPLLPNNGIPVLPVVTQRAEGLPG